MAKTDTEIGAKLSVDTGNSAKSINDIQKELKDANKALKEAKMGSAEYTAAQKAIEKANKELASATTEKAGSFSQLRETLKSTVPALDGAATGVSGLGKQLWGLAANPVVAILIAIVLVLKGLYEAFKSTYEGGKQLEQIFAGIKAVTQVVIDRLVALSGAVIKLFKGDFSGAMTDAKASVKGVGDEISSVYNRTVELTKELQKIRKDELADDLDKAKRATRRALLREQLNDEEISASAKKKIALDLQKDIEENAKDDLERNERKAKAQIALLTMQKDGERKNEEEINKIRIDLERGRTENALEGYKNRKLIKTLEKQEEQEDNERKKKLAEEEKERRLKLVEFTNRLLKLQQENELAIMKDGADKEKKVIDNKLADELRANQLSFNDKKITLKQKQELDAQITLLYENQKKAVDEKYRKDEAQKTIEFERALAEIKKNIKVASIQDVREKEMLLLAEEHEAKRVSVLTNEKLTEEQKQELILAIQLEAQGKLKALSKKYQDEDTTIRLRGQRALLKSELDLAIANRGDKLKLERAYFEATRALDRQELIDKKATALELEAFDKATTAARINLSDAERDAKTRNFEIISAGLMSLSNLVGQQTIIGKALGIASATIDTYIAAGKALKSAPPPFGAIAMGVTIAQGLANVKRIVQVDVPGATGSMPSVPSASSVSSPVAPREPQGQTTTLDQRSIQQIGNATNRQYVFEKDITNTQEIISQLNRRSRIG